MKTQRCGPFDQTESRIDLWIASLGASPGSLPRDYLDIVGNRERERFARLRRESDRERYLLSRVLLRGALSHACAGRVDPRCWQFSTTAKGKPAVSSPLGLPTLHFSLSHSNRIAVVAVSSSTRVGVDVEFLDAAGHNAVPADVALTPGEHRWLRGRPATTRWLDFIKLWTVKEAYAKLLGQGVYLDFASFEIAMEPLRMVRSENGGRHPPDLYLTTREVRPAGGLYQLSLAARPPLSRNPQVALHVSKGSHIGELS